MKQMTAYDEFTPHDCNAIVGELMQNARVAVSPEAIALANAISTFVYGVGTIDIMNEARANPNGGLNKVRYAPGVTPEQIEADRVAVTGAIERSGDNLKKAIDVILKKVRG
jgi:hypothetical protein